MSTKPSEASFPDLHHKMSKKIAQLTKVIYQLNTRNEDHQSELDSLTSNHQIEIQQVLRDAASKIGRFKELVEARKAEINFEAQMEKLQKKHEAEKQKALQEFNEFKSKTKQREMKLSQEFLQKFEAQRDSIEKMNTKFQEKLQVFEVTSEELRKSLEHAQSSSSSSMSQMKAKFEDELAEAVRTGNDKYQSMLVEQKIIQDKLREEMERKINETKQHTTEQMKAEMEQTVGQIRAQLVGDKQQSLLALKREWEQKMVQQREDFSAKLEKALAELRSKCRECDSLNDEKRRLSEELSNRLADVQAQMGAEVGGRERELNAVSAALASAKDDIRMLKAQVQERDEEIVRLKALLIEKSEKIVRLETAVEGCNKEIEALKADLSNVGQSGASVEADLRRKLSAAETEANSLRSEINQMGTTLAQTRDELKQSEKDAQKAAADAIASISTLTAERDKLQLRLDDALSHASASGDKMSSELVALTMRMQESEERSSKEKSDLEEAHEKALQMLRDRHSTELDAAEASKESVKEMYELKELKLREEMHKLGLEFTAREKALAEDHERALADQAARSKAVEDELRASIAALEAQIQQLSERSDGEKGNLQGEISRLENKYKALQKELETKKKEAEKSDTVITGLKSQIESLREELKATQRAYLEKIDSARAKLESDWQVKMDKLIDQHKEALEKSLCGAQDSFGSQMTDLVKSHEAEVAELVKSHAAEVSALKTVLQQEANRAQEEGTAAERERLRLVAELEKEIEARAKEVAELKERQAAEKKAMEIAAKKELEALRKDLQRAAYDNESQLAAVHADELSRMKEAAEKATSQLLAQMSEREKLLQKKRDEAMTADRERMKQEKDQAVGELKKLHNSDMAALQTRNYEVVVQLKIEIDGLKLKIKSTEDKIQHTEMLLGDEKTDKDRREKEYQDDREQLLRTHQMDIRREKELAERKLIDATDRFNLDAALAKQEFGIERQRLEEILRNKMHELAEMHQRWLNRESRPEDLAHIAQLERELVEKDELVARTREEMLYFKREMLNREENYNQKFNRQPNVGVMQVLKTKDPTSDSQKPGPGVKTSKPAYGVAPGGGSSSSLVGMGMGGVGMGISGSASVGGGAGTGGMRGGGIPPAANRRSS